MLFILELSKAIKFKMGIICFLMQKKQKYNKRFQRHISTYAQTSSFEFAADLIFLKLLIGKTLQDIITALVMPMTHFTLMMFVMAHNSLISFAK